MTTDEQKKYIVNTLDKFLEQYISITEKDQPFGTDGVCQYSVNLLKS